MSEIADQLHSDFAGPLSCECLRLKRDSNSVCFARANEGFLYLKGECHWMKILRS